MRVVLGVGGGIAAYKAAELVRALEKRNHQVQVVMTDGAQQFVRPLTFAALTGQKVITGLFDNASSAEILSSAVEHIGVARDHDLLVVAPATADLLAKFANGIADDFLTTLYLAFTGPVVLAPAMNNDMWSHVATQRNLAVLRERGHSFADPEEGWLACGTTGAGRLAEPDRIAELVDRFSQTKRDLEGEHMLITAGPTQEPLDPVRYITNRSSGKMGYALATAALARGAIVTLVSGPVSLPAPLGVTMIQVRTAIEMRDAVISHLEESSIIIKAAAVADYYLSAIPHRKMKKTAARLPLELDPTPDILAEVGQNKGDRVLIGFTAETDHLIDEARRKMLTKNCDMMVANLVGQEGTGFEADLNEVTILTQAGETIHAGPAEKSEIAERILDQILRLRLTLRAVDKTA
jgi:phosphopantothenoylcysteine decarboxylase / phosphopantothenate---cysteine ligase